MEIEKEQISGVYLVVDPSTEREKLLDKLRSALEGGVDMLQIWNHWPEGTGREEKEELINSIIDITSEYKIPVLINKEWELLKTTRLDGVHFDTVPPDIGLIRSEVSRDFIAGITCSNNLKVVMWAEEHKLDYISFCAMFPSPSVESCEIVSPESVEKAREITDLPLFLSGGITPDKIGELSELDFDGVAVISGILQSGAPRQSASEYRKALDNEVFTEADI